MRKQKKKWEDYLDPLYLPLFTAFPIEWWLLLKKPPFSAIEITLYIIGILFFVFSGAVETNSEEGKSQLFGYIYLISALLFASISLFRWLA
ncbi:hypothetical protein [Halobacillus karajensis]|uniref:hypothetical protein n=1 Tax=Halobacillus karajensis TaxID=195088 RepID=UPI000AF65C8B|nr:hypothetical protein [Halobacillus karajensis]